MPARMTSTAWAQGFSNALICAVGMMAVVTVGGWGLTWAGLPWREAAAWVFGLVFVASNAAFYLTLARDYRRRGRLILDCGPHPTRWLFLLEGLIFLAVAARTASGQVPAGPFRVALPALTAASGLLFLVFSTGRLQVREGGIWQYWGLLEWDRLAWYRWADDATLMLRGRGPFQFLRGALPVPPESQAEVKSLLAKHAPVDPLS